MVNIDTSSGVQVSIHSVDKRINFSTFIGNQSCKGQGQSQAEMIERRTNEGAVDVSCIVSG